MERDIVYLLTDPEDQPTTVWSVADIGRKIEYSS
jgi:hypothetical protein